METLLNIKAGNIVYLKSTIGTIQVVNGCKCKVIRVIKEDKVPVGLRVELLEFFSLKDGWQQNKLPVKRTFKYNIPAYQFFTDKQKFIDNLYLTVFNVIKIISDNRLTISEFT